MKSLLSLTALAIALGGAPLLADAYGSAGAFATDMVRDWAGTDDSIERRGRGRGQGGERAGERADEETRGGGGGHGGRPRIPGGSGCDDPGDLLEHPECRV